MQVIAMHEIAPDARVSPLADLEHSSRGSRLVVGRGASIDAFVKVKFAGGTGDVVIGEGSFLNSGVVIYSGNGVRIGKQVLIAANCTLAPVNHEYRRRDVPILAQRFMPSRGGIVIGDDVWIGANCVILDGAVIGRGAVIGACSLVRGEIEPYSINVGVPARKTGVRE
jgi:acetyltransferase-like isoleucine patch superfamily enzyme